MPMPMTTINRGMDYHFDAATEHDENNGGSATPLVHIPLRSRASVLRERNLLHLLEEEREDDASATFAKWARRSGYTTDDAERSPRRTLRDTEEGAHEGEEEGSDQHVHSRMLQEFSGEGTHFIDALVGSPAQRRALAVSSGADFTAFPCEGCTECGPIITPYRQTFSTSFVTMPCGRCVGGQRDDVCDKSREKCVARGYNLVDKSAWTAYESRDYFYVGGSEAEIEGAYAATGKDLTGTNVPERYGFPLVFACQTEATGWYSSQVQDGVIGFSTARTSFVNQMVFQDQLKYPRFCMCFEQKILMGDDMRSAGIVTLGGYNPHILDARLVFVQNTEEEGTRYKVYVRNIYLRPGGGQSIVPDRDGQPLVKLDIDARKFNERNGGTILDSGVPLLIFDESIQMSFLSEWKKMTGTDFTFGKMLITESDVKAFPTLIIQIKAHNSVDKSFNPHTVPNMAGQLDPLNPFDALLAIPATHFMEYNPNTGTYRAKINLFSKLGSFLGINAMQGHAFFYDLAKDRIGFAESYNCRPKVSPAGLVDDDMFATPTVHIETSTEGLEVPFGTHGEGDGGMPGETPRTTLRIADSDMEGLGTCTTATCISFRTVGYCIVFIVLAVAYRKYRPRDRSKQFDREIGADGEVWDDVQHDDETEVLNPEFEQHVRNSINSGMRGGRGSMNSGTRGLDVSMNSSVRGEMA